MTTTSTHTHVTEQKAFALLAELQLARGVSGEPSLRFADAVDTLSMLSETALKDFLTYAETQRVLGRTLFVLRSDLPGNVFGDYLEQRSAEEFRRVARLLASAQRILASFEGRGLPVVIMKTLDHWPDTGSDVDLLTSATDTQVLSIFKDLDATPQAPSWGDRLAHKLNFRMAELPELVEVHVGCLGQTGEHRKLASEVVSRRQWKTFGRSHFPVPSYEDQVVIATLQRMYRHFYIRLTDILNIYGLLATSQINFNSLRAISERAGIWPGVATLLTVSHSHAVAFGAPAIELRREVADAARFDFKKTHLDRRFVRVPLVPEAAKLYFHQLAGNGKRGDLRAFSRLTMLPLLAAAAYVSFRLTGDDKGVW